MAGTGVGKFSSTAGSNTANMTVNFAENMAPSNVNNAARELMGHMRDMYEQLGDGYFEYGDGDGTYTIARVDADSLTVASASDLSAIYFAGRKIRVTDGGANVVEGTIASTSHGSSLQTVNMDGTISMAAGTPTKVELGIDTAAFGSKIIFDDDGDTYMESAAQDDTIDIYLAGAKDFTFTANTFTAHSGSSIVVDDTTNSTSATTGSIQTDGGLGVALDAVIGDDLYMKSDGAVIHFGADSEITMTHVADAGLTISTVGNLDTLTLKSTDDDTSEGPVLKFTRDPSGVADGDLLGTIKFVGDDAGGNATDYFEIQTSIGDEGAGSEDGRMTLYGMMAGTARNILDFSLSGGAIIFNQDSQDIDFRIESNGNANMFTVDGGSDIVGIGTAPDLGVGLHIRTADSGSAAASYADELVLENSTHCGLTICSSNSTTGNIYFGDGAGAAAYRGMIAYDHNTDDMIFSSSAAEVFRIYDLIMATGDETAGDVSGGGICLQQKATDGNAISLKSSDIAHGITTHAETDTYAEISKHHATIGGYSVDGYSEGENAVTINGYVTDGVTGEAANVVGGVTLNSSIKSGTDIAAHGADNNTVLFRNNTSTTHIFKGDGEIFSDQTATVGVYDAYDDAQLVRAYDISQNKNIINSTFDKFVQYNSQDLVDARLIGKDEDGNATGFVNWTGMSRLHNGAIWQQYEKHQRLATAMYELAKEAVGEEKAKAILEKNEIKLLN